MQTVVGQLLLHLLILNRSQMAGLVGLALVYVAAVRGIYGFAVIKSVKSVQITMTATRAISAEWVGGALLVSNAIQVSMLWQRLKSQLVNDDRPIKLVQNKILES